jgi:hypothetical protein
MRTIVTPKRSVITPVQKRDIVRLLRVLRWNLKSAIDTALNSDGSLPDDEGDRANIEIDRRDVALAESLIKRLKTSRDDRRIPKRKTTRRVAKP